MKDNIRMQRVWNYDKNTPSSQSTSAGYINIPMHKLNGDSTRNAVINNIDEDDSSVVLEINSPSSNLGVDHDLDEEAANEFTKVLGYYNIRNKMFDIIINIHSNTIMHSQFNFLSVNRPIFQNNKS